MIWTGYHSTEISNRQTEMFSQKHIFYTFVGGTFSLDISIFESMKLADVTYLFRWLIIHINIFLITLKFMMTFVTCVAFHIIHDYSIFEQKNGSEKII